MKLPFYLLVAQLMGKPNEDATLQMHSLSCANSIVLLQAGNKIRIPIGDKYFSFRKLRIYNLFGGAMPAEC